MDKLQPKLRFPEFKGDWVSNKLIEVCDKIKDGTHFSPKTLDKNGEYQYLTSKNVKNGYIDFTNIQYISEIDHKKIYKSCDVKFGDVLLTKDGTIGQCCVNNLDYEFSLLSSVAYLRLKSEYNNYFLYQLLTSNIGQNEISKAIAGQALKRITLSKINEFNFSFPTLLEQIKLASFLSTVDEKLIFLKEKKEALAEYKKGMMQKIFSQEIRFMNENGENFADWEEKTFGEMSTIKRGASPRPITDSKWFDKNSNIGWVRISDVTKSKKFLLKTEQYLSEAGVHKSRLVKKGNLIMSICATIGKPIYTSFDVCIHDGFVVFEDLKGYREYFYYYLQFIQKTWYNYGQPGTQVNLNSEIVSNEILLFPCIEEQTKIANFLSAIDEKIELISNQLEDTQEYKKGLLQQMFI